MKQKVNTWIGAALILSVGVGAVFIITKAAQKGTSDFGYLPTTERTGYSE